MNRREMLKDVTAALGGLAIAQACKPFASFPAGAMCYDPVSSVHFVDYVCPYCDHTMEEKYDSWVIYNINKIDEVVSLIKDLGYDVVLDQTEYCSYCSQKEIVNPELIFKIRFSEATGYHVVKSNILFEYQCLHEYLEHPKTYTGSREIIQKMTGLGTIL